LTIQVSGFRSSRGKALIAHFRAPASFPDGRGAWRRVAAPIRGGVARARFAGLPPGRYAVSVLHDEDGDRAMATNLIGMPREGYGVSRDAVRRLGPPRFDDAAFALASGGAEVHKIRLVYP
jgi:uncharacterized protein (DUF2141 family)